MVHDGHAAHHLNKRKRVHEKLEPYPHPDKLKRFMDQLVYFVGVLGIVMTIPQITNIWVEKNASGVSAISWSAYLVTAVVWTAYGVLHGEKPIIITSAVWIFLDLMIII